MSALSSIENFISAAENVTLAVLGEDGAQVIDDAIATAESIGGTGEQKFSTAIAKAGTDLVTLGKDCGLFILHLAIQAGVAKLKSTTGVDLTNVVDAADKAGATAQPAAADTPAAGAAPTGTADPQADGAAG